MKPPCTDNHTDHAANRHRNLVGLTGGNSHQVHAVCAAAHQQPPSCATTASFPATMAHILDSHVIVGDRGYRAITSITTPRRDNTGRIIHGHHYRAHRRIRAGVEHVTARLKDWQILRQYRRRDDAINHSHQIVTGPWNLKNHTQSRVNS